jgi:hypothetical protein
MSRRGVTLTVLLPLLGTIGCIAGTEIEPLPQAGDFEQFVDLAQPILAARCANPSCHSDPDRPLFLYATHRRRLDPADTYLDTPLSDDELTHNHLRASLFVEGLEDGSESLLLRKPLAVAEGGVHHAGITVFLDASDYGYRTLHAWIETALGHAPTQESTP